MLNRWPFFARRLTARSFTTTMTAESLAAMVVITLIQAPKIGNKLRNHLHILKMGDKLT